MVGSQCQFWHSIDSMLADVVVPGVVVVVSVVVVSDVVVVVIVVGLSVSSVSDKLTTVTMSPTIVPTVTRKARAKKKKMALLIFRFMPGDILARLCEDIFTTVTE